MAKLYNITKHKTIIDKEEVDYALFTGGRNIGKSYQVKHEVIRRCLETDSEFTYLRREDRDIKTDLVQGYFADVDIALLTHGEFTEIYVYQSKIYLATRDDKGRVSNKRLIGYAHALNIRTHYKSVLFPDVRHILFEEFIPDGTPYLANEPTALQEYVSTIARLNKLTVWIVGNTITKLCPYYHEWHLTGTAKMRPGQIDLYHNTVSVQDIDGVVEHTVTISIEYCSAKGLLSKMAFGDAASQIVKNEYRTQSVPRITVEYLDNCCDKCYTVYMIYQNLKFVMILCRDQVGFFWYVRPADGNLQIEQLGGKRCITDIVDADPYHTRLEAVSQKEQKALAILKQGRVFFSDDMTGTDFKNCYRAMMVRGR